MSDKYDQESTKDTESAEWKLKQSLFQNVLSPFLTNSDSRIYKIDTNNIVIGASISQTIAFCNETYLAILLQNSEGFIKRETSTSFTHCYTE